MASVGKFIANKFLNVELKIMVAQTNEWLNYTDGSVQSYSIIVATPVDYDEPSGVLTLKNNEGQEFYVNEEFINAFWNINSEFNFLENTNSTIYNGGARNNKKRDIM